MYRKISTYIEDYLSGNEEKILCISGARQVGKSYIIRELAKKHYTNYVELNMAEDKMNNKLFSKVKDINSFYVELSVVAGDKLNSREDTIVFIDEIQEYPHLLTLLKPLRIDNRYKYICSGSELGLALKNTTLTPMGSIINKKMYPMDFEEFLIANSIGTEAIKYIKDCYINKKPLEEELHNKILYLFKTYLYVGGMPDAIKSYIETKNVYKIKEIQNDIINLYHIDASKYDKNNKLKIKRIYDMIPSVNENKVKRIKYKQIEGIEDARYNKYENEFEYLLSSGIALGTVAVSQPKFPLIQSSSKNLIKLYLNDIGLLTNFLYKTNINNILNNDSNINLGSVYESVVAQELKAHDHELYYFDRRKVGEVDYLIDDYKTSSVIPIEVKSGKYILNAKSLPKIINDKNYNINISYVLSNNREVIIKDKIIYLPIYYVMFL